MKITKTQLRRIIKEEISKVLNEMGSFDPALPEEEPDWDPTPVKAQPVKAEEVAAYLEENWHEWVESEEEKQALITAFSSAANEQGVVESQPLGQALRPFAQKVGSDMIIHRANDIWARFMRGDKRVAQYRM